MKQKTIGGLTKQDWNNMIVLVHKYETAYEDFKRGKKRGGIDGSMDKIIRECPIWQDIQELEEKIRTNCFKLDGQNNSQVKEK